MGPGLRYSKNGNTVVANLFYQYSQLNGTTSTEDIRRGYNNLTYFAMTNIKINSQNTIRIFANSSTENPNITRLQGIYDVSNAQFISRGNPELSPAYTNMLTAHYVNSSIEKGRTFMVMGMAMYGSNFIGSSVEYNKRIEIVNPDGSTTVYNPLQYTTYTNLDGNWSVMGNISYGMPVNFIRSNINLNAGVMFSQTPSLINGKTNMASTMSYNGGITLGSNISQNVDFTLAWNGNYSESKNSLATAGSSNQYFSHTASGNIKLVLWGGITLTASASYNQNVGFTNDYNESYILCNAFIGKKLFKNQLGEVLVGVNDIFNQNTAFARTAGSGFTQNSWNSVIGRYVSVQFNYNLRLFGKKGSKNIEDYQNMNSRGGFPGGFPGGMGGGRPMGGMR